MIGCYRSEDWGVVSIRQFNNANDGLDTACLLSVVASSMMTSPSAPLCPQDSHRNLVAIGSHRGAIEDRF